MVTIIGLEKKTNLKTKESYLVLTVQGSAEVLTCALSDLQAKALIGQTLPGSIEKVECTPFEVKLPTGKKLKITETYQFQPEMTETVLG
jgi:hypothetical protein